MGNISKDVRLRVSIDGKFAYETGGEVDTTTGNVYWSIPELRFGDDFSRYSVEVIGDVPKYEWLPDLR